MHIESGTLQLKVSNEQANLSHPEQVDKLPIFSKRFLGRTALVASLLFVGGKLGIDYASDRFASSMQPVVEDVVHDQLPGHINKAATDIKTQIHNQFADAKKDLSKDIQHTGDDIGEQIVTALTTQPGTTTTIPQ